MNKVVLNIMIAVAILALAGCTATPQVVYLSGKPILSATDAKTMIQVEVKELQPEAEEPLIVAAVD